MRRVVEGVHLAGLWLRGRMRAMIILLLLPFPDLVVETDAKSDKSIEVGGDRMEN